MTADVKKRHYNLTKEPLAEPVHHGYRLHGQEEA